MSTTSTALMTAEELMELPRGEFRYELISGELKTMSPSGFPHGQITALLTAALVQLVYEQKLGAVCGAETGFKLTVNPDTVLAPDIAFISRERIEQVGGQPKGYWPGPPDLAVEVTSLGDPSREVIVKTSQWLSFGAKQVWIVDPEHSTVTVYRSESDVTTFSASDYLEAQDLFPGFRISLERIFKA